VNGPADGCSTQKIEAEFIDDRGKSVSRMEFDSADAHVVDAGGWPGSFDAGLIGRSRESKKRRHQAPFRCCRHGLIKQLSPLRPRVRP
jgi:hypothetical protein